jgi:putative YphP/YqiW family bacilliredoxin
MYDPKIVKPMREELTKAGFQELTTPSEVDQALKDSSSPVLLVINSVCGCAAGGLRPGVVMSTKSLKSPVKLTTVFAGQDKEATERARSYIHGYPASSPSVALFKDGEVVNFIGRHDIEGHSPEEVASKVASAINQLG